MSAKRICLPGPWRRAMACPMPPAPVITRTLLVLMWVSLGSVRDEFVGVEADRICPLDPQRSAQTDTTRPLVDTLTSVSEPTDKPLRKDAERNRQRLLTSAGELFAERGLDVTLHDIAE